MQKSLRKQGLKQFSNLSPISIHFELQESLRKQGLKLSQLRSLIFMPPLSCKSGLRKQGLKPYEIGDKGSDSLYLWLQRSLRKQGLKQFVHQTHEFFPVELQESLRKQGLKQNFFPLRGKTFTKNAYAKTFKKKFY